MAEIEFYDVKSKKKFKTGDFDVRKKTSKSANTGKTTTRWFAVAKSKSGPHECWRVLSEADAMKFKK